MKSQYCIIHFQSSDEVLSLSSKLQEKVAQAVLNEISDTRKIQQKQYMKTTKEGSVKLFVLDFFDLSYIALHSIHELLIMFPNGQENRK